MALNDIEFMETKTKKYFRLPREFAENWIKALESGKFTQGQISLFEEVEYKEGTIEEYCCLGVAGIICGYDKEELRGRGLYIDGHNQAEVKHLLPRELVGNDVEGAKDYNILIEKLINLNDACKYSFKDIANWIKENIEFY